MVGRHMGLPLQLFYSNKDEAGKNHPQDKQDKTHNLSFLILFILSILFMVLPGGRTPRVFCTRIRPYNFWV
jgi:hypothetical protein